MEEEALKDAHQLFVKDGYNGDITKFKNLISTDKEALNDAYKLFVKDGYNGDVNKFSSLVGLKKKDNSQANGQTPAKESTTPTKAKKSLLAGESPKKPLVSDGLVGENKKKLSSVLKENKLEGFITKKKPITEQTSEEVLKQDKKATLGLTEKSKGSLLVSKTKTPTSMSQVIQGNEILKNKKIPKVEKTPEIDFDQISFDNLIGFSKGETIQYAPGVYVKMTPELKPKYDAWMRDNYGNASVVTKGDSITNEDILNLEEEYKEVKGGTFFEGVKAGLTGLQNYLGWGEESKTGKLDFPKPLDNYKDEVKKDITQKMKEDKNYKYPTNEEFESMVKNKYLNKRTEELFDSKKNLSKERLSIGQQFALTKSKEEQYNHLNEEAKKNVDNFNTSINVVTSLIEEQKPIVEQIKKLQANKQPIPEEVLSEYNRIQSLIDTNSALANTFKTNIDKDNKKIGSIESEMKIYSSHNNELYNMYKDIKSWGEHFLGAGIEGAASYIGSLDDLYGRAISEVSPSVGNLISDFGQGIKKVGETANDYLAEQARKDTEGSRKLSGVSVGGVTESKGTENVNDVINNVVSFTGKNLGMVAMTLTGSGAIPYLFGVEAMGSKRQAMRTEDAEFQKEVLKAKERGDDTFEFDGKKYNTKEQEGRELYSEFEKFGASVGYGISTAIPIAVMTNLNKARIIKAATKQSPDLIKKSITDKATQWMKNYSKGALHLTRDLKIMGVIQYGIDLSIGKETDFNEAVMSIESFRDPWMLHLMNEIGTVGMGRVSRPYMSNKNAELLDNNSKMLVELGGKLKNTGLSSEERSAIISLMDRVNNESQIIIQSTNQKMSEMSNEDYRKVVDLHDKSSNLRIEAKTIKESKEFSDKDKKIAIEKVHKDYIENEREIQNTLDNYTKRTDGFYGINERDKSKLYERAEKELISDAKERGDKKSTFTERDKAIKASEIWSRENTPVEPSENNNKEQNIFYYNTDPKRGNVEEKLSSIPEGYNKIKEVENGFELDAWNKQKAKELNDKGEGIDKVYNNLNEVPEFLRPLAKAIGGVTEVKNGLFGKKQRLEPHIIEATPEEVSKAYDDFYGSKEAKEKEYTPFEEVTPTEEPTIQDSQIPLKRETFEVELDNGSTTTVEVTTNKDGSRSLVTKADGFTSQGEKINKDNTLSTEEYISKAYGKIKGEAKVEQGSNIINPKMKDKLTPKQKAELGIEEVKPTETSISEKESEVERLRAEEQKEYEGVDPSDKVKLGEIYNRYDKLISPLLKEIEGSKEVEVKTTEENKSLGQKVSDVLNRPATLESFGGSKLESPIEGDLYQEGQRIIFEDKNNKTYDLGGVEELGKNAEEIGLKPQEAKIEVSNEGKVIVDGSEWNMQMELPTKGIEYDKDGNITKVSLKDNEGKTKMWDGQIAEDIGYQVLLKEMENPARAEEIEKTLKEDEQHQNRITEVENAPKEGTDTGNEQNVAEVKPARGSGEKTKVEEPVTEEKGKGKEDVSLPKDINEGNVEDVIKQLMEKGIATKPC